jgi:NAD(P)-dependent dehydrogenase (short-subunit alcohol dehydrogenase family)
MQSIFTVREGAKIVVAARRASEGEETVRLIKEAGSDGSFVNTDVANEASVKSLIEKTINSYHSNKSYYSIGCSKNRHLFVSYKINCISKFTQMSWR